MYAAVIAWVDCLNETSWQLVIGRHQVVQAVAVKVLPNLFVADTERIARFQCEAKTLAALNRPNIGAIHGFEECDGTSATRPGVS